MPRTLTITLYEEEEVRELLEAKIKVLGTATILAQAISIGKAQLSMERSGERPISPRTARHFGITKSLLYYKVSPQS